ncbi:MAG: coniferyl-alcohol dehydrogenase [Gammaproteobacteria bacterium]|nr:coniferyl-alcohol dehydrogenase [Gammaproteobacteria bacterium]
MRIIVTGGASGVGAALVERLAGHEVWILDVQSPNGLADAHRFIALDLADAQAIDRVVANLPDALDGLANVAGIAQAPQPQTVVAVNFLGLRHLTERLTPRLVPGGGVVNVSSVAGRDWQLRYERLLPLLETQSFAEGMNWCQEHPEGLSRDPYTFSKRLVTAYTLRAAQEAAAKGYRINCVSPGPVDTPLYPEFEAIMGKAQSDWARAQVGTAKPSDIAEVVALLLTGDCGWLNGVDIPVDGGYTAGLQSGWIDFAASPVMMARRG